jgi:hypothetical protein
MWFEPNLQLFFLLSSSIVVRDGGVGSCLCLPCDYFGPVATVVPLLLVGFRRVVCVTLAATIAFAGRVGDVVCIVALAPVSPDVLFAPFFMLCMLVVLVVLLVLLVLSFVLVVLCSGCLSCLLL